MKEIIVEKNTYGELQKQGYGAYEKYLYKRLTDAGFDMTSPVLVKWHRESGRLRYIQKTQDEALGYDTKEVVTQSGLIIPKSYTPLES